MKLSKVEQGWGKLIPLRFWKCRQHALDFREVHSEPTAVGKMQEKDITYYTLLRAHGFYGR